MKAYYYLYYRLYTVTRLAGWASQPQVAATFQISIADFLVLAMLSYLVAPHWTGKVFAANPSADVALMAVCFFANYLLFLVNHKYEKIVQRFAKESRANEIIGSIIVVGFVVLLIGLAASILSSGSH